MQLSTSSETTTEAAQKSRPDLRLFVEQKRGTCSEFCFRYTARLAGLPARFVSGYSGGTGLVTDTLFTVRT